MAKRNKRQKGALKGQAVALPDVSALMDVPAWGDVGPTALQNKAFEAWRIGSEDPTGLEMGCVCRLDRGFPAVLTKAGPVRAEHAVRIAKESDALKPAVGDWVALRRPDGHDMAVIEEVLPRKSEVARWRGGSRGERQTLAANVDVVLCAQAEGRSRVSLDRAARAATVTADCGAAWAVVITKADRAPSPEALGDDVRGLRALFGPEIPVVACASLLEDGSEPQVDEVLAPLREAVEEAGGSWGVDAVRALVPAGHTGMVLGESGVGKSTLLNALLGHESLETGAVRERDGAGRHTTVCRRMVKLPGAGVIIDCPGLRSLPLVGHEQGLAKVFPEVASEAGHCRFRDCTHGTEPGCAVVEAAERGAFAPEALVAWRSLAAEMRESAGTLDPDVRL
ncbi:ribosome small subunit-dependent GTPase A [Atopobiaceae bacterium 24-176]